MDFKMSSKNIIKFSRKIVVNMQPRDIYCGFFLHLQYHKT